MKKTILILSSLYSFYCTSQCLDFTVYTQSQLNSLINSTPIGGVFVQQGDISLVKSDPLTSISLDTTNNAISFYSGFSQAGLKIAVSTSSYPCKKLTFTSVSGGVLYVDNDTISYSSPFFYNGGYYTVNIDVSGNYDIQGSFDTVHFQSTTQLGNLCLDSCDVLPNGPCLDFTVYTQSQLNSLINSTPIGGVFVQQGDISLVKSDPLTSISLDTNNNAISFYSGFSQAGLKIAVSTSSYPCKKLTFTSVSGGVLYVDNDTIPYSSPFFHNGGYYTVNIDVSGNYDIQGAFDTVHFQSTTQLGNLCLDSCGTSSTSIEEEDITNNIKLYPNPTNGSLFINLSEITNKITLNVRNSIGQLISSEEYFQQKEISININGEKGLYFIEFKIEKGNTFTKRVIKN